MKKILLVFVISAFLAATATAGNLSAIIGTWSGNWAPKGGTLDAITVELRLDEAGKLTGKFVSPTRMDFSKTSFNPSTEVIAFQATDSKTNKVYKVEGKVKGTELIGTLAVNDTTGEVRLIKWTFFAR